MRETSNVMPLRAFAILLSVAPLLAPLTLSGCESEVGGTFVGGGNNDSALDGGLWDSARPTEDSRITYDGGIDGSRGMSNYVIDMCDIPDTESCVAEAAPTIISDISQRAFRTAAVGTRFAQAFVQGGSLIVRITHPDGTFADDSVSDSTAPIETFEIGAFGNEFVVVYRESGSRSIKAQPMGIDGIRNGDPISFGDIAPGARITALKVVRKEEGAHVFARVELSPGDSRVVRWLLQTSDLIADTENMAARPETVFDLVAPSTAFFSSWVRDGINGPVFWGTLDSQEPRQIFPVASSNSNLSTAANVAVAADQNLDRTPSVLAVYDTRLYGSVKQIRATIFNENGVPRASGTDSDFQVSIQGEFASDADAAGFAGGYMISYRSDIGHGPRLRVTVLRGNLDITNVFTFASTDFPVGFPISEAGGPTQIRVHNGRQAQISWIDENNGIRELRSARILCP